MDYKEKYDKLVKAIEVLQKANPLDEGIQTWVNENVPELRNSEDKNIIKEIISIVKSYRENCITEGNHRFDACLAWLKTHGEQKPADKPKTAFHEGQWIVQENIGVYKVIEVCESWYEVIDIKDNHYSIGFDKEYMCHLWSIEDAKLGDVLTNGKMIVIFKNFEDPSYRQHIVAYIGLDRDGDIQITDGTWRLGIDKAKPATKEQRELLFQKMHEAGYIFDFKKKELKKIHMIDEGKSEMDYCFTKMMNGEKVTPDCSKEELQLKEGNFYKCIKSYHHLCGNEYWFDEGKVYFCEKDGYLRSNHNNLINVYDCKNWQSYFHLYTGKPKQPKFNIGDWIVSDLDDVNEDFRLCKIIGIEDGCYTIQSANGSTGYNFFEIWESDYRLWSIEDAKDGDVLSYVTDEEDLWIMIYWSLYEPYEGHVHYHALLVNDNFSDKGTCCICINDLKPATKEQHDLLFSKMKEEGYEWDSDQKELKKINWNDRIKYNPNAPSIIKESDWSEEDERIKKSLINYINAHGNGGDFTKEEYITWLEQQGQPDWSEEDEAKLKSACALIRNTSLNGNEDIVDSTIDWIKSIRSRNMWIIVDEEVYVKEPVLAQKKDKSDPFGGFVVCCDHMLTPNIYERYMILGNS